MTEIKEAERNRGSDGNKKIEGGRNRGKVRRKEKRRDRKKKTRNKMDKEKQNEERGIQDGEGKNIKAKTKL